MLGKRHKRGEVEKVLDVDASMQGSLIFKDPVNLRINGKFEGMLNTRGNLMIGEHASISADVTGETIIIAGKVNGNINAIKEMKLISPACVVGDIRTPLLSIAEGAVFEGNCKMLASAKSSESQHKDSMTADELSKYLEIDSSLVSEWAALGKIPAVKDGNSWRFDRRKIDEWVANEKIK